MSNPTPDSDYISAEEVEQDLGITPEGLATWITAGKRIRTVSARGTLLYFRPDLEHYHRLARQLSGTSGRISADPSSAFGKPVLAGTRISVDQILAELAGGHSCAALLEAFPQLTREDITAALEFARRAVPTETQLHTTGSAPAKGCTLLPEKVPRPLVRRLRQAGHEVILEAPGTADAVLLSRAAGESALLLTWDKDFRQLVLAARRPATGVLLVRLDVLPLHQRGEVILRTLHEHGEQLSHLFTTVYPDRVESESLVQE